MRKGVVIHYCTFMHINISLCSLLRNTSTSCNKYITALHAYVAICNIIIISDGRNAFNYVFVRFTKTTNTEVRIIIAVVLARAK